MVYKWSIFRCRFLPSISPEDSSSNDNFCERVRETMAQNMGVQLTQFDERDVIDLKKRPDLFQRRHGKSAMDHFWKFLSRIEFQHNVETNFNRWSIWFIKKYPLHLSKQFDMISVRFFSITRSYYTLIWLEMTKNVQRTIDNLNERATAAARAANQSSTTSSRAMPTSSNNSSTSNHRQTYERLKQELIEKNRQLFLNKNCN